MHPYPSTFYDGRPHYVIDAAGCWLWQGGVTRAGYGLCSPWTGQRLAHRWYYTLYCGPLRKGLDVHHICGVPGCVNPAHLEAVTRRENLARRGCRPWPVAPVPARAATTSVALVDEEWRAVPGYEGYYSVSSLGRVRRDHAGQGARAGYLCKPQRYGKGYMRVTLTVDSQAKAYAVHRLVGTAFLRPPLTDEQINHRNGIKADNRLCNLEWCTGQENIAHSWQNGMRAGLQGQCNGRAKLTRAQVQEIRELRGMMRQVDIAGRYGIAQSQVSAIQLGITWRD